MQAGQNTLPEGLCHTQCLSSSSGPEGPPWLKAAAGTSQMSTGRGFGFQAELTALQGGHTSSLGLEGHRQEMGTKNQHKAINNRSEFRAGRVLGNPTFPVAGDTQLRAQWLYSQGHSLGLSTVCEAVGHRGPTPATHTAKPLVTPEGTV